MKKKIIMNDLLYLLSSFDIAAGKSLMNLSFFFLILVTDRNLIHACCIIFIFFIGSACSFYLWFLEI